MYKRIIIGIVIAVVLIGLIIQLIYLFDKYDQIGNLGYNPAVPSGYQNVGYYKIDPKTIITSMNQGRTDVFMPLLENPDNITDDYNPINWGQSDYLKIANALSQEIWHEPLDLQDWTVHDIFFQQSCEYGPKGFNLFDFSYYKTDKISWEVAYSARYIMIEPWLGIVEWGGTQTFTVPFWDAWHSIDLMKFKIPAEIAVEIAEQNGGREVRLHNANKCQLDVSIQQGNNEWRVNYFLTDFGVLVDPYNGSYKILSAP